ncbi:RNA-directed DNA polymerase, eukaryota, reverse transcriptase zinc-binding domain protein [Tanacetum coccineum]
MLGNILECLKNDVCRKVGDGARISFWRDRWINDGRLMDMFHRLFQLDRRNDGVDNWKWLLAENGIFSVKALTKLIVEKCIDFGNNTGETMWNKLVPKKVNIFMWRVGRGRLPVRVELDKRGIDLHTHLCPSCDEVCETIDHSLVLCNEAMNTWGKVFEWWKIDNANAFSTNEMFRYAGNRVIRSKYKPLW